MLIMVVMMYGMLIMVYNGYSDAYRGKRHDTPGIPSTDMPPFRQLGVKYEQGGKDRQCNTFSGPGCPGDGHGSVKPVYKISKCCFDHQEVVRSVTLAA